MILAGDVGGTKCNLGLFLQDGLTLRSVFQRRPATREYAVFENLVGDFLIQATADGNNDASEVDAAGFGVAGVVAGGRHYSENLPWVVEVAALANKLNLKNIRLLNDLTATALSLERLSLNDFVSLNSGTPAQNTTPAVMAAEGGQADFAPRTEREIQLLSRLRVQLPHVSCEEIVSGRGFRRIHEFLKPSVRHASFESSEGAREGNQGGNAASEITQLGLAQSCPVCVETLGFWTEIFGGVTGNFALQTMALGGIYIAGGIAVKILSKLKDGTFFKSFCGTGKLAPVLARIPISVVVNEDAPIWGAAYEALISSQVKA